jgi:peroxiredoxin family protein
VKMILASMLAVLTLSVAAADETPPSEKVQPISAVAVSTCGKAVAIFVTFDKKHMLRFDARSSTLFVVQDDGTVSETRSPAAPIEAVTQIAASAAMTSHVVLPCTETTA